LEDNKQLKQKNKILLEEHSGLVTKHNYTTNNSDFTSNLKKLNMEELKQVTQTNSLVNDSIAKFSTKISSFKKLTNSDIFY
jgi:hemoglobin-like flavoprotein